MSRVEGEPGWAPPDELLVSGSTQAKSAGLENEPNPKEDVEILLPLTAISERVGLSAVRIRALLKEGRVKGELRLEGRGGQGQWYTSVAAVQEYKKNLPTPQEFGRKGGLLSGRWGSRQA